MTASSPSARVEPTTEILELRWRPELRVLERRTELVRSFEASKQLASFRFDDQEVSLRLVDGMEMSVSLDGMDIARAIPASSEAQRSHLSHVLAMMQPTIVLMRAWFSHVIPLTGNYDEIRRRTGAGLFGSWWPVRMSDWSLLAEGPANAPGANYQCEFGIVSKAEIPGRVTRQIGRVEGGPAKAGWPSTRLGNLPEVALFMDSHWLKGVAIPTSSGSERVAEFYDGVVSEANALAASLHKSLTESLAPAEAAVE
ncbi:MAG TPA: hypothetical protein VD771_02875 [Gemmatimonadaceae bacterium]|nr:hypothetical protein [Gemmatimonadaceae bacterium]